MRTLLTDEAFLEHLRSFRRTAHRLELQPEYREPYEADTLAAFLAGQPQDPREVPVLRDWFNEVAALTAQGRRIARVRVHEDPPTPYQQWERWIGHWNTEAGETIHYLTRQQATLAHLLPAAGTEDWWLLDDERLLTAEHDDEHRTLGWTLITDQDRVDRARAWWDLAVRAASENHSG